MWMMLLDGVEKNTKSKCFDNQKGQNWYVDIDGCEITVNAYSYTIITAHKIKK